MVPADCGIFQLLLAWPYADFAKACDPCRLANRKCERKEATTGLPPNCDSCIEIDSLCSCHLAYINISRPHHTVLELLLFAQEHTLDAQQNFQLELILLEEQNKVALLMAREYPIASGLSSPPTSGAARSSYQWQLTLRAQQKSKRLLMARQNQAASGLSPAMSSCHTSSGSHVSHTADLTHEMFLEELNSRLLSGTRQPLENISEPPTVPAIPSQDSVSQAHNTGRIAPRGLQAQSLFSAKQAAVGSWSDSTPGSSKPHPTDRDSIPVRRDGEERFGGSF